MKRMQIFENKKWNMYSKNLHFFSKSFHYLLLFLCIQKLLILKRKERMNNFKRKKIKMDISPKNILFLLFLINEI